jgi:hypothetical protein
MTETLDQFKTTIMIDDYGDYYVIIPDEIIAKLNLKPDDTMECEYIPGHLVLHKINK